MIDLLVLLSHRIVFANLSARHSLSLFLCSELCRRAGFDESTVLAGCGDGDVRCRDCELYNQWRPFRMIHRCLPIFISAASAMTFYLVRLDSQSSARRSGATCGCLNVRAGVGGNLRVVKLQRGRDNIRGLLYGLLVTLLVAGLSGTQRAVAQSLTVFRYEYQAHRHCPEDSVVWLNFKKRRYYVEGQRRYGSGFDGSFACKNEARSNGYRRSPLGLR